MERAPVALFVYNRPHHTRQTVGALLENEGARDTDLFVFSDGARTSKAEALVQEVRDYAHSIDGFRSLNVIERPANVGLRASIIDGVTRVCSERGRVIVLEDDLVTSPHFLDFMNTSLERYATDDHVMQVAGYMFPTSVSLTEDAIFLPVTTSWGWATWIRAWRHFNGEAAGYERLEADRLLRRRFDLNGHYKYFRLLKAQRQGKADSWAILWYLCVFLRQGLALYPRKTLVRNIGFDGSGANPFIRRFKQEAIDSDFRVNTWPMSTSLLPQSQAVLRHLPSARLTPASILRKLSSLFRGGRPS